MFVFPALGGLHSQPSPKEQGVGNRGPKQGYKRNKESRCFLSYASAGLEAVCQRNSGVKHGMEQQAAEPQSGVKEMEKCHNVSFWRAIAEH